MTSSWDEIIIKGGFLLVRSEGCVKIKNLWKLAQILLTKRTFSVILMVCCIGMLFV
jgi:hypothetical protein